MYHSVTIEPAKKYFLKGRVWSYQRSSAAKMPNTAVTLTILERTLFVLAWI